MPIGSGILGIAVFWSGLCIDRADGQKEPEKIPQPAPAVSPAGLSSVNFMEDADSRRVINVGRDCIADEDWSQAIQALQHVLDKKTNHNVRFVERDPANPKKEITRWTSAKNEANNLIGSMPAKALEAYEAAQGAEARALFEKAKKKNDLDLYAEVAQRFRHTKAGAEAHRILAARLGRN
jgi:hypothetical protein